MPRIQMRPVRLRKWFPPNDPVATAEAMLCILREDFLIEMYGFSVIVIRGDGAISPEEFRRNAEARMALEARQ